MASVLEDWIVNFMTALSEEFIIPFELENMVWDTPDAAVALKMTRRT